MKQLTSKQYWNQVWEQSRDTKKKKPPAPLHYEKIVSDFFHRFLPTGKLDFIEFGCAPGRFMEYFAREFSYHVNGIDNSDEGISQTKKLFSDKGDDCEILCQDILNHTFSKQYDVVFSAGLIEHFFPPTPMILKHLEASKKGGYIVIGVPNLKKSLYYYLQKFMDREILDHHVLLDRRDVEAACAGYEIITCQYVGVFNLYVNRMPASWRLGSFVRYAMVRVVEVFLHVFRIHHESAFFSPYIYIILKNK